MKNKLKNWLLINFAGYPFSPTNLIPDNGMATLAGVLISNGCDVEILDTSTVDMLEEFIPKEFSQHLKKIWAETIESSSRLSWWKKIETSMEMKKAETIRIRYFRKFVNGFTQKIIAKIEKKNINAIGIKLWSGEGFTGVINMAFEIKKKFPNVFIVGGGPHVDSFMEKILADYNCFDAVVFGEGEKPIEQLIDYESKNSLPSIPNLLFKSDHQVKSTEPWIAKSLDDIPFPSYDPAIYPAMSGNNKIKLIMLEESRGCKNNCAYCIHPIKSHCSLRLKSISRLIAEIDHTTKTIGTNSYRFSGSCTPYSLLNDFARRLLDENKQIEYLSFAHVRGIEEANLPNIKKSGCNILFFGIESGDQNVLDLMRKGTRVSDISNAIQKCREVGIQTIGSLIFPAPGETKSSEENTFRLLTKIKPDALSLQAPIIIPRTEWFNHPENYRIHLSGGKKNYLNKSMHWKVKFLHGPKYWDPLPVKINGLPYKDVISKTSEFIMRFEKEGVVTSISDDILFLAGKINMPVKEYRDWMRKLFFTADIQQIREMVETVNSRL